MAQSVKLKDGSLIDTEGIYDATQGKTQAQMNAIDRFEVIYRATEGKTFTFTTTKSTFWILYRGGMYHVAPGCNPSLMIGSITLTLTRSGNTYTAEASSTIYYFTVFA